MAEQRLIDANALLEKRRSFYEPRELESITPIASTCVTVNDIYRAPTIDAVPVLHAFWRHIGGDEWCCTDCALVISTEGSWEKPWQAFCPNCGAKMDGGVDT